MFVSTDDKNPSSFAIAELRTQWFYATSQKERMEIIRKALQRDLPDLANEFKKRIDEPFKWF